MKNNSEEIPETLYKYRSWNDENHKRVLTENELFAASPALFNDPFDCTIPLRYELLTGSELMIKAKKNIRFHNPYISNTKLRETAKRWVENAKSKGPEHFKNFSEYMIQENLKHYGVISLTKKSKNILMWSHYADCHKGFCIGFNSKKLYDSLKAMTLRPMHYDKKYPIIKPLGDTLNLYIKQFYSKSNNWSYEKEYRLILEGRANKPLKFDPAAVSQIILGCKIQPEHKNEIIKIIDDNYIGLPVFQAERHLEKFKLVLTQIR
jgi:hypothetical protein